MPCCPSGCSGSAASVPTYAPVTSPLLLLPVPRQLLPIDLGLEDHKEIVKKSQLGKNIMFLFKCTDETPENRRISKELVHKWCRPIFYDHEAEEVRAQRAWPRTHSWPPERGAPAARRRALRECQAGQGSCGRRVGAGGAWCAFASRDLDG
jgi:hypothetical protein